MQTHQAIEKIDLPPPWEKRRVRAAGDRWVLDRFLGVWKERLTKNKGNRDQSLMICMFIYILYVYIYIFREREVYLNLFVLDYIAIVIF